MRTEQIKERVDELLTQMTLREKVMLLSGVDNSRTAPIERLGIPSFVLTDGPHGVRTPVRPDSQRLQGPTTSFPTGVSMAASWDPALIERMGVALGEETLALGCDILLGPCVNIVRTPLAGRNFETYAEDPFLAGWIGVAWVKGVQSQGVGASLKHFACNNQEVERLRGNSEVDERTLREIYLTQFETIVKEAQPWTVMCSYNRLNGTYASEHRYLLTDILRGEWGFQGAVISDWNAVHSTAGPVAAGLDLEMPGPAKWLGELLIEAVTMWQVEEAEIDRAVRRLLRLIVAAGRMDGPRPAGSVNTPAHQALARRVAQASMTLLKNEGGVLPLERTGLRKLAVIGPNATECRIGGGGSSFVDPPYAISPLEGLRAKLGESVQVGYAQGCDNYHELPAIKIEWLTPAQGDGPGLWAEFFDNADFKGEAVLRRVQRVPDTPWFSPPSGMSNDEYAVRWSGRLTAPASGRHILQLASSANMRLYLDGELLLETLPTKQAFGSNMAFCHMEMREGREHDIRIELVKRADSALPVVLMRVLMAYDPLPEDDTRLERAVALAATSDVAVVVAGMPTGYESEGHDRPHAGLPGRQVELIRAVAAANPKTIVVLNVGAPIEMPWIDDVPAVLLAYYQGQEGGNALADILFGDVNPSGKLPVTFPVRYQDNPTLINYPGGRTVRYGEGVFVGYRYYDAKAIEPLFPFGHGLSYTTFQYNNLQAPVTAQVGEMVMASIEVGNIGPVAGMEVVQLYVHDMEASVARPPQELKGFQKVALEPGEVKRVTFELDTRAFSFYDVMGASWVVEPGMFELRLGSSSRDIRAVAKVELLQ